VMLAVTPVAMASPPVLEGSLQSDVPGLSPRCVFGRDVFGRHW
jgi:hypothetical protein